MTSYFIAHIVRITMCKSVLAQRKTKASVSWECYTVCALTPVWNWASLGSRRSLLGQQEEAGFHVCLPCLWGVFVQWQKRKISLAFIMSLLTFHISTSLTCNSVHVFPRAVNFRLPHTSVLLPVEHTALLTSLHNISASWPELNKISKLQKSAQIYLTTNQCYNAHAVQQNSNSK